MNIKDFYTLFQQGEMFFHANRLEDARISFLKASRLLYELAKENEDIPTRTKWVTRADRVRQLAEKINQRDKVKVSLNTTISPVNSQTVSPPKSVSDKDDTKNTESKWKLTERPEIRFADIAGLAEVKALIHRRVIFPMKNKDLALKYKRKIGAGIMMYGPPGTGKTMMAKVIAGELDAPFFSIKSSSIMSKWVGEAEQNIRDLFEEARRQTPSVIFFDESEALLAKRGGNSTVMNRVIPEFLSQVDGVSNDSDGLLLIGATNRPWDIDPAAMRPGRFGDIIYIPLPDFEARQFLLKGGSQNCLFYFDIFLTGPRLYNSRNFKKSISKMNLFY